MPKPKYIETPEKLWELFEQYVKHEADNPMKKTEFVGKEARKEIVHLETPITFPWCLNGVYILVGVIILGLIIICIIYMFKKSFPGWFGVFAILVLLNLKRER